MAEELPSQFDNKSNMISKENYQFSLKIFLFLIKRIPWEHIPLFTQMLKKMS